VKVLKIVHIKRKRNFIVPKLLLHRKQQMIMNVEGQPKLAEGDSGTPVLIVELGKVSRLSMKVGR